MLIDRVRFRGDRASGVEVVGAGGPETLAADAVVMALGTYATPAALLRSGVGPAPELARHDIPVVAELAGVGRGMQDHPKVSYRFDLGLPRAGLAESWYQCLLTGAHEVAGERRVYQVMPYSGQVEGGQRFTDLNVQVSDARSRRGAVRLQSRDPADQPIYRDGLVPRAQRPRRGGGGGPAAAGVASAPALAGVLSPWPGLADPDQVLRTVETFHHPVGSCRMGRGRRPRGGRGRPRARPRAGGPVDRGRLGDRARPLGQHPPGRDRAGRAPGRRVPGGLSPLATHSTALYPLGGQ